MLILTILFPFEVRYKPEYSGIINYTISSYRVQNENKIFKSWRRFFTSYCHEVSLYIIAKIILLY